MNISPRLTLVLSFSGIALLGCNDPVGDKPRAEVSAPIAAAATANEAPGKTVTYVFAAGESKVEFVGAKVTGKHDGSFGAFRGTVQLVDDDPEKSSVNVEIDTASIEADDPKLTGHLKSADFFDVEKYPKARFTSTSVRSGASNGGTHTITGNLEMHGVTKAISFPAKVSTSAEAVNVDAEFAINRKDFGIIYPGMPDDLIRDDVLVRLRIVSKKPN